MIAPLKVFQKAFYKASASITCTALDFPSFFFHRHKRKFSSELPGLPDGDEEGKQEEVGKGDRSIPYSTIFVQRLINAVVEHVNRE